MTIEEWAKIYVDGEPVAQADIEEWASCIDAGGTLTLAEWLKEPRPLVGVNIVNAVITIT